jgi:hypothetical protein
MASGEVSILISAKDGASRVLAGIEDRMKKFGSSVAGTMTQIAAGFGIGFGVTQIVSGLKNAVEQIDRLADSASNLGVSTDAFQALQWVATKTGNSFEQVQQVFEKVKIAQSGIGDKKIQDALAQLGISAQKFASLKPEDAFAQLGRAITNANDPLQAFKEVTEIFGEKLGPKMLEMLRSVAGDGFGAVIDQAKAAGAVLEEELVQKVSKAADQWDAFKKRMMVAGAEVMFDKYEAKTWWQKLFPNWAQIWESLGRAAGAGDIERAGGVAQLVDPNANNTTTADADLTKAHKEVADEGEAAANKAADEYVEMFDKMVRESEEALEKGDRDYAEAVQKRGEAQARREAEYSDQRLEAFRAAADAAREEERLQLDRLEQIKNSPRTFQERRAARLAEGQARYDDRREERLRKRMEELGDKFKIGIGDKRFLDEREASRKAQEAADKAKVAEENAREMEKTLREQRHKEMMTALNNEIAAQQATIDMLEQNLRTSV